MEQSGENFGGVEKNDESVFDTEKSQEEQVSEELENVINWAQEENWEAVDGVLKNISDENSFINWAKNNLDNENTNLQDLAASIFEVSDSGISWDVVKNLENLMNDAEPGYAGFRAACALAKRIENEEIKPLAERIKEKLQEFQKDPDVSEIAEKYLKLFEQQGE